MAASRSSSIRALRQLAASNQRRSLHMTGPSEFSSVLLTTERPTATKVKRDIEAAQRQSDLAEISTPQSARHFNTSRSLKSVGDSSTIDFAYLPDFDPDTTTLPTIRIPLLPSGIYNTTSSYAAEAEEPVMRPEIVTVSADSTYISSPAPMSEMHDNGSVDIHHIGEQAAIMPVGASSASAVAGEGMVKQLWDGVLEDLFGRKRTA